MTKKPDYTELLDAWDEMLSNGADLSRADAEFNQELFCDTLRRTWQIFRDETDFDMPDDAYALNTELLKLLMKITAYSRLTQVQAEGNADVGLSAFIAKLLKEAILDRKLFPRDKPILKGVYADNDELYNLSFDMDTEILTVSDTRNDTPPLRFDSELLDFVPVPQPIFEPFEVKDLAKPRFYSDK